MFFSPHAPKAVHGLVAGIAQQAQIEFVFADELAVPLRRIGAAAENNRVERTEGLDPLGELARLGRTTRRVVFGIEIEHQPVATQASSVTSTASWSGRLNPGAGCPISKLFLFIDLLHVFRIGRITVRRAERFQRRHRMKISKMIRTALCSCSLRDHCDSRLTAIGGGRRRRPAAAPPNPALLDPSLATATAPDTYKVKVQTTTGSIRHRGPPRLGAEWR